MDIKIDLIKSDKVTLHGVYIDSDKIYREKNFYINESKSYIDSKIPVSKIVDQLLNDHNFYIADTENYSNSIKFSSNYSKNRLNFGKDNNLYLKFGDLSIGDIKFIVPFTSKPITVYSKDTFYLPKRICGLENSISEYNLKEFKEFIDKIFIFRFLSLNNPHFISYIDDSNNNYIDDIINLVHVKSLVNKNKDSDNELDRTLNILQELRNSSSSIPSLVRDSKELHNIIAVIRHEINLNSLKDKDNSLYHLRDLDIIIDLNNRNNLKELVFEHLNSIGINNKVNLELKTFRYVFIVDNNDVLGDRYTNVNGLIYKVEKIKSIYHEDGLYIIDKFENGRFHVHKVCDLRDENLNKFHVFSNIEECINLLNAEYIILREKYKVEKLKLERDMKISDNEVKISENNLLISRNKLQSSIQEIEIAKMKIKEFSARIEAIEDKLELDMYISLIDAAVKTLKMLLVR